MVKKLRNRLASRSKLSLLAPLIALTLTLLVIPSKAQQATAVWTKNPANPVVGAGPTSSWDSEYVAPGSVVYYGQIYLMWYTGANANNLTQIGLATSPDGITWTKYAGNPVLSAGSGGSWDSAGAGSGKIVRHPMPFRG